MNIKDFNKDELWEYLKDKIIDYIQKYLRPASEVILDDKDIRDMLKISRRTSLDWRDKGFLRFHKVGEGKIYYILQEVIDDIKYW